MKGEGCKERDERRGIGARRAVGVDDVSDKARQY